jgi:hypothetical protein
MSTVPINRARPLPPDLGKALPNNLDAERSVLGAILLNNAALKVAADRMDPSDFFLDQHRRIFLAMTMLDGQGSAIDLITLTERLHADGALEAAGGAAYMASLADGMPKVSNVAHYADIVKQKSRLRQIIHHTYNVQQKAFEGELKPDDLCNELETFSRSTANARENPMVRVGWSELLTLDMPAPEWIFQPLLTVGGSMMVYSWAGVGKSWFTTDLCVHIALGESKAFGLWPIPAARRVLYLYGEMHGGEIKDRGRKIMQGHKITVQEGDDAFTVVSKEYQRITRASRAAREWRPSIYSPTDRRIIEDAVASGGYKVLALDNVSTLWPSSQEASSDREAVLKNWFIDLNQNGVSIISLTHSGKGGDFLGDSQQVHILDSVLRLRDPSDKKKSEGLRAEVKVEKLRHECKDPRLVQEFEVTLETSPELGATWLTRPLRDVQLKTAFGMFTDGMKEVQVHQAMGGDPSLRTVYRWRRKYLDNSDPAAWSGKE